MQEVNKDFFLNTNEIDLSKVHSILEEHTDDLDELFYSTELNHNTHSYLNFDYDYIHYGFHLEKEGFDDYILILEEVFPHSDEHNPIFIFKFNSKELHSFKTNTIYRAFYEKIIKEKV